MEVSQFLSKCCRARVYQDFDIDVSYDVDSSTVSEFAEYEPYNPEDDDTDESEPFIQYEPAPVNFKSIKWRCSNCRKFIEDIIVCRRTKRLK